MLPFEAWLRNADRSEQTVRAYLGACTRFARWFEAINRQALSADSMTMTPSDLRLYRESLIAQKLKPTSINAALAALRTLGLFVAEHYGGANPAAKLPSIELSTQHAPRSLSRQDQFKLHQALDRRRAYAEHHGHALVWIVRDEAMIQLMLNPGLRVDEVCKLDVDDVIVRERSGSVTVRQGKGLKHRVVPLNAVVRDALRSWLTVRRDLDVEDADALFVTKYRERIGSESVRHLLREISRMAGIKATPHTLRHSFAKGLVDAGESLDRVGELLGHSSLDTTRIYTAPTHADLERAVARLEN